MWLDRHLPRNKWVRSLLFFIYDMAASVLCAYLALWIRFDCSAALIPGIYLEALGASLLTIAAVTAFVFAAGRMYSTMWGAAGIREICQITGCCLMAAGIQYLLALGMGSVPLPRSFYLLWFLLMAAFIGLSRMSYRLLRTAFGRMEAKRAGSRKKRVMIVGGGQAGAILIKELKNSDLTQAEPVCVVDDDRAKVGRYISGVPVKGTRTDILKLAETMKVDEIYIALPSASAQERKEILEICQKTGKPMKTLPGIYQLANGEVSVTRLREVEIEDLLGREPIHVNLEEILEHLKGKTILVTGGGGSIGSELCRQIAGHAPKRLIIFDIYENNAYDIEQELRRTYPDLNLEVLIGSVRDSRRINQVFEQYRPDIVYHAAAHKHVPLMETSPNEAIKNNVIGTYKTAYAALKYGTSRFVLISTDKAVNPTNIMGASKRLCEMVIQSMDAVSKAGRMDLLPFLHAHADKMIDGQVVHDPMDHMAVYDGGRGKGGKSQRETAAGASKEQRKGAGGIRVGSVKNQERTGTQFVAVRFGNVLGSNGSVIPLFKKQIAEGGPVTVTHPEIIRYFMTIPEAVSLVLQAGTYAWGGEIFVLDMGAPVKIDTLARNLIKLSGYEPDEDIKIVYTGLRPGEKLFEEKLMAEEGLKKTENELIHIGKPIPFDVETFLRQLEELAKASYENSGRIVELVEEIVPTFHPSGKKPTGMGRKTEMDAKAEVELARKEAAAASEEKDI